MDAEDWEPANEGDSIQGCVVAVDPAEPAVTIETAEGKRFRINGLSPVLGKEIRVAAPRVGDLFAVSYFGQKTLRTGRDAGKSFRHYRTAVRRNTPA